MTALACQNALDELFKADAQVRAALGDPVRLYSAPVKMGAFPFAFWRRFESRPIDASDAPTQEHIATIEIVSRQTGAEEARKAVEALVQAANGSVPQGIGARIVLVLPVYSDVMRAMDGRSFVGIVRLKIIAEPL
jgi:Protein of unknown function (DUF3168)